MLSFTTISAILSAAALTSALPAYQSDSGYPTELLPYDSPSSTEAYGAAYTSDSYGAAYTSSSYDADYYKSSSTYDSNYYKTYTTSAYGAAYTPPSKSNSAPFAGATHRVLAGFNGLRFEPENIVAEIGDLIEVHFNPLNHSFAQSSFEKPCVPISDDAIFSGFQPTMNGEAPLAFTIVVKDDKPLWFYCAQTKGAHCQMGMAMVVNQNFNSDKTLANYKIAANTTTEVSIAPPKVGNGGVLAPPKMKFNGKA